MLIGTLALRKLHQVFFPENSVISFSLTKINHGILLDCDLVDVYRIVFVVMCFPNTLGKRVPVTERNVPHTESKRGKLCPQEALGHVTEERARQQRFRYCFGIFLRAFPGMTVSETQSSI